MPWNVIITLVVSSLSLVVSIFALSRSAQANEIARGNQLLNHAQVEMEIRRVVTEARTKVEEFTLTNFDFLKKDTAKLSPEDQEKRSLIEQLGESVIEGYLNALDEACQKFLDGKVDVVRFKKSFQREIRQTVQDKGYADNFKTGHSYHALMKVYETWENQEK